jgi:predicted AlkP superfamily pyrophosphatase or phosphodiesterase
MLPLIRKFATAAAVALALAVPPALAQPATPAPLTLLISIDAFRPDYLGRGVTPNLRALAAGGVFAEMRPSFPSKTFPNHYTLVTGRRPDETGIVANNMIDPGHPGTKFTMANRAASQDGTWWDEAKPIWTSAEEAGKITAPIFWPGSEADYHGLRPRYFAAFDGKSTSDERVNQDLALLDKPPAERPAFMTLYFDAVDTAGHHFGPDSKEVNAAAAEVDAAIGKLAAGLKARGVIANIVIVSDHGMAALSPDRQVYIDDILPKDSYTTLDLGPIGTIYPVAGHEADVEKALVAPRPHMQCWKKQDIPARFHYGHNPRVAPLFCLPDPGWVVTTHDHRSKSPEMGDHGYDNLAPEMRATFIASGPEFRHGVKLKTFDNVDVYPLLARLLGVTPQPNDGTLADLAPALAN